MKNIIAIISGLSFIFIMSVAGSVAACFVPQDKFEKYFPYLNGFSGGVMAAASVWSLVLPSLSSVDGRFGTVTIGVGIIVGGLFILLTGRIFSEKENGNFNKLFTAMTAHNVPEGIVVGFALGGGILSCGNAFVGLPVAIGIGLQNFPEGAALTLPARKIYGKRKSLFIGVKSGIVEPIGGVIGLLAVKHIGLFLPYLMSFAAGAMLFVVFSEFSSENSDDDDKSSLGAIIGFVLMMIADVLLG